MNKSNYLFILIFIFSFVNSFAQSGYPKPYVDSLRREEQKLKEQLKKVIAEKEVLEELVKSFIYQQQAIHAKKNKLELKIAFLEEKLASERLDYEEMMRVQDEQLTLQKEYTILLAEDSKEKIDDLIRLTNSKDKTLRELRERTFKYKEMLIAESFSIKGVKHDNIKKYKAIDLDSVNQVKSSWVNKIIIHLNTGMYWIDRQEYYITILYEGEVFQGYKKVPLDVVSGIIDKTFYESKFKAGEYLVLIEYQKGNEYQRFYKHTFILK